MPNVAIKKTELGPSLRLNKPKLWTVLLVVVALLTISLALYATTSSQIKIVLISLNSGNIEARVAQTPAELETGLSGTATLANGQGMLFVFKTDSKWIFWMKDMNYPIDIIWLDSQQKVVYIEPNLSPNTYPKTFQPDKLSRYVLELPANYTTAHKIKIGALATFKL